MNNRNSLEGQINEAVERCKGRKCEGCPFNGVSACCVTILLHIQHTTATFEKDGHHLRCSNCGEYFCSKDYEGNVFPQKYCPNCGAKMELLKKQEPHLLTEDDFVNADHYGYIPAWTEERNGDQF